MERSLRWMLSQRFRKVTMLSWMLLLVLRISFTSSRLKDFSSLINWSCLFFKLFYFSNSSIDFFKVSNLCDIFWFSNGKGCFSDYRVSLMAVNASTEL